MRKLVEFVKKKLGDVGLKQMRTCDVEKAQVVVFGALYIVLGSVALVPAELRHKASVLKVAAGGKFGTRAGRSKALSGYFFLRYVVVALVDPRANDRASLASPEDIPTLLAPLTRVLQSGFNLQPLNEALGPISGLNARLMSEYFRRILEFTTKLATCEVAPAYARPPEAVEVNGLRQVVRLLSGKWVPFRKAYKSQCKHARERLSPAAYGAYAANTGHFECGDAP